MPMPIRWLLIAAALAALPGCAGHTEKTSPCACAWTPVGAPGSVAV